MTRPKRPPPRPRPVSNHSNHPLYSALDTFLPGGANAPWSAWMTDTVTGGNTEPSVKSSLDDKHQSSKQSKPVPRAKTTHPSVDSSDSTPSSCGDHDHRHQGPVPRSTAHVKSGDDRQWFQDQDSMRAIRVIALFVLLMVALACLFGMVCLRYHAEAEKTRLAGLNTTTSTSSFT